MRDKGQDVIVCESQCRGLAASWHNGYVIKLGYGAVDSEPLNTCPGPEVDDLHAAPGLGVRQAQAAAEVEPLESAVTWF